MHYVGVDLHRRSVVVTVVDEQGQVLWARSFACVDQEAIQAFFRTICPFKAVIEASSSYRWLYDLISPLGVVVLAHPLQLRAIVSGRAKTDKLDSQMLATLLRANLVPTAYVPPERYQRLRDFARGRARLSQRMVEAKNELHTLLRKKNVHVPYVNIFCKSGKRYIEELDLDGPDNVLRDELVRRMAHFEQEIARLDEKLVEVAVEFPEVEALSGLHGIGLYSALLIVGEIGEPWRFRDGRKVGAYAGLTARVNQSGDHCYHGHITRQGSPWLRWILVQVAMKVVRDDRELNNFYMRVRKRSSAKIARVAVARKLAAICWVRLRKWYREQAA